MKNLFPGYMGIPIPVPTIVQQIFLEKFSATEIYGESHSHIIAHTDTIINNLVFYMGFFGNCVASETT